MTAKKNKKTNPNNLKLSTVDRIGYSIHLLSGKAPVMTGKDLVACMEGICKASETRKHAAYLIMKNIFEIEDVVNHSDCLYKTTMSRLEVGGYLDGTVFLSLIKNFADQ